MKQLNLITVLLLTLAVAMPATLSFAATQQSTKNEVAVTEKININTATADTLVALPGVGPATAKKIQYYREKNGNFKTIEDLVNVKGIGEKSLKKLKPYLTL